MQQDNHTVQGFTLIELLVTLAVAAIVFFVGIPSMSNMIHKNQQVTATNDLVMALNYARSQAVKSGRHVSVCPSKNGTGCVTGTGHWADGLMIFSNKSFTNVSTREESEEILRVFSAVEGNLEISAAGNIGSYVSFRPTGDSDFQGSWIFCDSRAEQFASAVSLFRSGRAAVDDTLWDDSALSCGQVP